MAIARSCVDEWNLTTQQGTRSPHADVNDPLRTQIEGILDAQRELFLLLLENGAEIQVKHAELRVPNTDVTINYWLIIRST
jgi:hypothetical protein